MECFSQDFRIVRMDESKLLNEFLFSKDEGMKAKKERVRAK